jgi:hypothetical protein
MNFLIQEVDEGHPMYLDITILRDLIRTSHHEYTDMSMNLLKNLNHKVGLSGFVPIGDLEFVQYYLKEYCGIDKLNPIDVPDMLRRKIFLKRNYDFKYGYDLPTTGSYFIKDVSELKKFTHIGNIEDIQDEIIKDHLYQISDIIDIKSEYRVFIIDGKIHSINYYNGDPCVLPDVTLIQNANAFYALQPDYPKSYSMDVAVTSKGTCILECHVLFSCGLYTTLLGYNFLQGYQHAMEYTMRYNTEINPE